MRSDELFLQEADLEVNGTAGGWGQSGASRWGTGQARPSKELESRRRGR